jgi:hypothetical protein
MGILQTKINNNSIYICNNCNKYNNIKNTLEYCIPTNIIKIIWLYEKSIEVIYCSKNNTFCQSCLQHNIKLENSYNYRILCINNKFIKLCCVQYGNLQMVDIFHNFGCKKIMYNMSTEYMQFNISDYYIIDKLNCGLYIHLYKIKQNDSYDIIVRNISTNEIKYIIKNIYFSLCSEIIGLISKKYIILKCYQNKCKIYDINNGEYMHTFQHNIGKNICSFLLITNKSGDNIRFITTFSNGMMYIDNPNTKMTEYEYENINKYIFKTIIMKPKDNNEYGKIICINNKSIEVFHINEKKIRNIEIYKYNNKKIITADAISYKYIVICWDNIIANDYISELSVINIETGELHSIPMPSNIHVKSIIKSLFGDLFAIISWKTIHIFQIICRNNNKLDLICIKQMEYTEYIDSISFLDEYLLVNLRNGIYDKSFYIYN